VSFKLQAPRFKPATAFAILILLVPQDSELEAALKADRARIAAKKPLTKEEMARYRQVAARPAADRATYRLAVIPVSFPDAAANRETLQKSLLEPLVAYFRAQSAGAFELVPTLLEDCKAGTKRAELAKLATGVEAKILQDLVKDLRPGETDGILFVAGGEIGAPGTALWPHKSVLSHPAKGFDYVLLPQSGDHRWFGIAAHEVGHLLKLEDKYEDREARVGRWCLMGTGYLDATKEDPRPGPLCAVCRASLGWFAPVVHDPSAEAEIALPAAVTAAVRVPINKDGREAVVLETRGKSLLVWHTGGGRPIELAAILPTASRDRLTPWSDPAFRARTLGAVDLWITDVRVQEGRAWFRLGPKAELTPLEELRRGRVGRELGK
jgi:M6 family metalloprotease-like protein